jgi:hypothetical protein
MDPSPVPDAEAAPAQGEDVAPSRKRARFRLILIGVLGVLLVGGGVAAAGGYLGWYGGGGSHPYDVMPASTIAYVQLDLNPSLEQKTQAWSFLHDLPEVQEVTLGQPDPKRVLWSFRDRLWVGSTWTDFDTDLKPWLGDRIGVGILGNPADPNKEAIWVTAIQVTDPAKAVVKLQNWLDATNNSYEVTTRDGYAIITAKQTASIVHEEQAKGLLRTNQRFRGDLASVGEIGWMAGWLDSGQLAANSSTPSDEPGREAFALRFSGDTMELAGRTIGTTHPLVNGSGQLGALPATTGSAFCVTGGVTGVPPAPFPLPLPNVKRPWPKDGLNAADTAALLGNAACVSAPRGEVTNFFSTPNVLGLRIVADDPGRAREVLQTISSDILPGHQLVAVRVDGNLLTAATTKDYLAELAGPGDELSSLPAFTKAVPESRRAALAFFMNLESIGSQYVAPGSPYEAFGTSLKAIGGQYFDEGSGNGSWSVRIVRD